MIRRLATRRAVGVVLVALMVACTVLLVATWWRDVGWYMAH